MMHRPPALSAVGKAKRRSSLLRPPLPKSPRNTVRRTVPVRATIPSTSSLNKTGSLNDSKLSRLATPLPSSRTTGRSTTLGIPSGSSVNTSTRANVTIAKCTRQPVFSTSSRPQQRHSTVPVARPPVISSRPASRASAVASAPRAPSEIAQLKEKLAFMEQQLGFKTSQLSNEQEMHTILKDKFEMVKMKLDSVTEDRDLKIQLISAQKEQLEALRESLAREESLNKGFIAELEKKEVVMRKLHNDVVDLRGQIRVAIRVRPILKSEEGTDESFSVKFPAVNVISVVHGAKSSGQFEFEKVFTPVFSQEQVFANIEDFIMSALHGYNVGLIAFGQTGSGKTHTMRGGDDEKEGVIPRAGKFLFNESKRLEATGWKFEFSLSFLEIYNNEAYDLLDNHKVVKLRLCNNDVIMDGLSKHPLVKLSNMAELLRRADGNRKTAVTKCNASSSRSHAIYMWNIKAHQESTGISTSSTLKLVDLAGSERVKESMVTGQQFNEMTAINTSLSALQKCIGLQRSKAPHVPYRDSKLTQVLMDSLGRGNSKTMVIVNINPCYEQAQESKRSIEFAAKMRDTNIGAAVQQRDL